MKIISREIQIITICLVCMFAVTSFAIEGLKLKIVCPHVVLTWPSTNGETFLVQYRTTLDTDSVWQTLTNFLPAKTGTNVTSFVHSNQVDCPPGQIFGMMQAAGGGEGSMSSLAAAKSGAELVRMKQTREAARLKALLEQCQAEGRDPAEWELKNQPPLPPSPEEVRTRLLKAKANKSATMVVESFDGPDGGNGPEPDGGGGGGTPVSNGGFYRVVRNGVYLTGVTNGQVVSDIVRLPVEVGFAESPDGVITTMFDPTDALQPAGVFAVGFDEAQGIPVLNWDTARATNGNYQLRPTVVLAGGVYVSGPEINVVVSNRIQLPDWPDAFGSGLPIAAIIDSNNAPYQITISNAQGSLIRTLNGTANGYKIEAYWDGLDELGNDATDGQFMEVTISFNPGITRKVRKEISNANLSGQWLVANQNLYNNSTFLNNMNQINTYAADNGGTVSGNNHAIHSGFADWLSFVTYLRNANCRNLFYFGHGTPSTLGFGSNDKQNGVTARDIARFTGNSLSALTTTNDYTTNKVFRFVFLDGCTTGNKDSILSYAFGIQPVVRSNAAFSALGIQPRAFVGWKSYAISGPFDTSHSTFTLNFFTEWMDNDEILDRALFNAAFGTIGQTIAGGYPDIQIWGSPELLKQ